MTSIRWWLLGWLITGLGAAALLSGFGIFHTAREEARELFDYELRTVALSLPTNLGQDDASSPDFMGLSDDRLFIEIWDQSGRSVYRSINGVDMARFPPGLRTIERDGYHWRVFGVQKDRRFIQVAQPVSVRQSLAVRLALRTLWPLALLIPAIIAIILLVVSRGLVPLASISQALATRSLDSLEPLRPAGRMPVELRPLVGALNDLLERLGAASRAQRTFIADAAHELRSPLTALKLQVQADERDGSLVGSRQTFERIHRRLNRVIHLVQQLLALAHEDLQRQAVFESFSLRRLCERLVGEYAVLAEAKSIDLGLDVRFESARDDDYQVKADAAGLEVLLGNLLDNAIRYTPPGGRVDVFLERRDGGVAMGVSDDGPGIPPEDRARVFDRFYRGAGNSEQGSGLGLAIALQVANRHRASLELTGNPSGRGLCVRLRGLCG